MKMEPIDRPRNTSQWKTPGSFVATADAARRMTLSPMRFRV
jgi:hypothetical protein